MYQKMKRLELETTNLISGCGVDSLTSPHIYGTLLCLLFDFDFIRFSPFGILLAIYVSGGQHDYFMSVDVNIDTIVSVS